MSRGKKLVSWNWFREQKQKTRFVSNFTSFVSKSAHETRERRTLIFSIFLLFYRELGGGVAKKVNLKSSRYALKPKIGQLGHFKPFFLFFYISTGGLVGVGGNGRRSWCGGLQMWLNSPTWLIWPSVAIFIFFSTVLISQGGGIVKNVDLETFLCDLKPQIGQFTPLETFFLLFYFSTGEQNRRKSCSRVL